MHALLGSRLGACTGVSSSVVLSQGRQDLQRDVGFTTNMRLRAFSGQMSPRSCVHSGVVVCAVEDVAWPGAGKRCRVPVR